MLKARDIMTEDVWSVGPEEDLITVTKMLVEKRISGMPVCDENKKIIGMISEKDLLNFIFSGNIRSAKVRDAMSRDLITFPPDTDLDKISLVMGEKQIRRIPIVEDGRLVGIVSRRSIIKIVLDLPEKLT